MVYIDSDAHVRPFSQEGDGAGLPIPLEGLSVNWRNKIPHRLRLRGLRSTTGLRSGVQVIGPEVWRDQRRFLGLHDLNIEGEADGRFFRNSKP